MNSVEEKLLEYFQGFVAQIETASQNHLEWVKLSSSHFERLVVLNGAALALSFTASASLRTIPYKAGAVLHLEWLLAAWLILIGSIMAAVICNLLLVSSHSKISANAGMQIVGLRTQMMGVVIRNDDPEKAANLKTIYNELPLKALELTGIYGFKLGRAGWVLGLVAQVGSILGLTCLAIYFVMALQ